MRHRPWNGNIAITCGELVIVSKVRTPLNRTKDIIIKYQVKNLCERLTLKTVILPSRSTKDDDVDLTSNRIVVCEFLLVLLVINNNGDRMLHRS